MTRSDALRRVLKAARDLLEIDDSLAEPYRNHDPANHEALRQALSMLEGTTADDRTNDLTNVAGSDSDEHESTVFPGLRFSAYRAESDNVLVVHIDTSVVESPTDHDINTAPRIRVYLNDDPIWENPRYGAHAD